MPEWLVPIVALNLSIAVAGVLIWFLRGRARPESGRHLDLFEARDPCGEFVRSQDERIAEYVRTHWSGRPADLPDVVKRLLDQLEQEAARRQIHVERGILGVAIVLSLENHGIARGRDLARAIEKVA